ncbi:hypothetical protein, partial [Nocardia sp.]|uniref:hypothetical protein n=1 Tax=Nocardia sp. TaxID=1821 RepID=UPI00258F1E7D
MSGRSASRASASVVATVIRTPGCASVSSSSNRNASPGSSSTRRRWGDPATPRSRSAPRLCIAVIDQLLRFGAATG